MPVLTYVTHSRPDSNPFLFYILLEINIYLCFYISVSTKEKKKHICTAKCVLNCLLINTLLSFSPYQSWSTALKRKSTKQQQAKQLDPAVPRGQCSTSDLRWSPPSTTGEFHVPRLSNSHKQACMHAHPHTAHRDYYDKRAKWSHTFHDILVLFVVCADFCWSW